MKQRYPAVLFFLTLFCLPPPRAAAQVVGGNPQLGGIDFFCSLVDPLTPTIEPVCGASLIAPQWVLTAGHCGLSPFTLQQLDSVDVVIHPYLRNNAGAYLRVRSDQIFVHRNFDIFGDMQHDIALIKLRTPVPGATLVGLPPQGSNQYAQPGDVVGVAGYGIYDIARMWAQPDTLQIGIIRIIANDTCNEPGRYNNAIAPTMICAGLLTGKPQGGAAGDSGGPLFAGTANGPVQVGVVSWGMKSWSDTTHPGVYTRVSSYRSWIDSVMAANSLGVAQPVTLAQPKVTVGRESITVQFEGRPKGPFHYAVYSVEGRVVSRGGSAVSPVQIPVPDVTGGLYYLKLADERGYQFTTRVRVLR